MTEAKESTTNEVATLKCSSCKEQKPLSEFPGSTKGRPGYRCIECSLDERVRMNYRKQIKGSSVQESEAVLLRKYKLADIYKQELDRFKLNSEPVAVNAKLDTAGIL